MRATADLTAAARIRDAAVVRFARDGLGASLKTIAADAGVSSGLILHHFGTKQGLRRACDEWVLAEIREAKHAVLATGDTGPWLTQLGQVDRYAPLAMYVARSVQAGGPGATRVLRAPGRRRRRLPRRGGPQRGDRAVDRTRTRGRGS